MALETIQMFRPRQFIETGHRRRAGLLNVFREGVAKKFGNSEVAKDYHWKVGVITLLEQRPPSRWQLAKTVNLLQMVMVR